MHSLMVPRDVSPQTLDIRSLYTFHESIGIGRTGTVYKCTEIQSRNTVAIKVIKAREVHGFNEYRLCQWVETLIGLDVEGIVKFYKVYTDKSHQLFYIIMKYYSNGNITNSMSGNNRHRWLGSNNENLLAVCARLLSAIAFLHNQLWLLNTTTTGLPIGAISSDNILLDEEFSPYLLPGIGTPMNWTSRAFSTESLNNELLTLAPEKILAAVGQRTQHGMGTQPSALINPMNKKTTSIKRYLTKDDLQVLMKHKDALLKPTFASDSWALGCLLFALVFQRYPFRHSDIMSLSYGLPEKGTEASSGIPKPISEIIRGLLVTSPSGRISVLQALSMLPSPDGRADCATDYTIEQPAKASEKIYSAQLKYIISTMDESLAKLSTMLLDSVNAQTEAQEEVTRLLGLKTQLEADVQVKSRTILQLKYELKRIVTSMKIDISKADEIDTDNLTSEELVSLESECKKVLDKIANTRLLRRSPECVVCLSRPKNIKLDPCKHVCICHECYLQLPDKRCPICRATVISIEKVFL